MTLNGSDGAVATSDAGLQPDGLLRGAVVQHHHDPGRQADRVRQQPDRPSGTTTGTSTCSTTAGCGSASTPVRPTSSTPRSRTTTAKWHHMVATQGADGMRLYVDGVLAATNPQTQAQRYTGYWRVGGDTTWGGNSSNYFAGSIDEVAVYSTRAERTTVQAHYRAGAARCPTSRRPRRSPRTQDLTASFDGTGSTDTDGTVASYCLGLRRRHRRRDRVEAVAHLHRGRHLHRHADRDRRRGRHRHGQPRRDRQAPANVKPTAAFTSSTE